MDKIIVQIILHMICFAVAFYSLNGIDLNRFIKQGRVLQAQLLLMILSMALGYLMAQFLLALSYPMYFF